MKKNLTKNNELLFIQLHRDCLPDPREAVVLTRQHPLHHILHLVVCRHLRTAVRTPPPQALHLYVSTSFQYFLNWGFIVARSN